MQFSSSGSPETCPLISTQEINASNGGELRKLDMCFERGLKPVALQTSQSTKIGDLVNLLSVVAVGQYYHVVR